MRLLSYQNITVMVDILTIYDDVVHLYEVKSATEVKEVYVHDASIQYYVLNGLGYFVETISIIHINNSYIREDALDISKLFKIVDITDAVIKTNFYSMLFRRV